MKSSWKTFFAGKRGSAPAAAPWSAGDDKDVLFVFDQPGAWTRYRSDHQAEALRLGGLACDVVRSGEVELVEALDHYGCVVLNRVEWTKAVAEFLDGARTRGRPVVFDTDDLIFEPDLIDRFAVFDGWPETELMLEVAKLERYRRTLEHCDGATVTTEPLREHVRRYVDDARVLPNAVSAEMVLLSDRSLAGRSMASPRSTVTIAYLSGTRTHKRDFLEAADAVLWALDAYPQVRFQAVGKLELDPRFERFADRVERIPLQPWQGLPDLLARVDVNLAPLERANPVTECKSCVKFLEAALVGVPTIASARPDFVRVIEHGDNGLLAEGEDEWREALRLLVGSDGLRKELGERAREETLRNHTTAARAPSLAQTFAALATTVGERELQR
jgi:glycosyltransferase involved in cell wall biosynthesis